MNEEFDIEAFDRQWEEDNQDSEDLDGTEDAVEGNEDVEGDDHLEEDHEEDHEGEDEGEEAQPDMTDEQKRNAAFAQLRRERDEAAKQAAFLQQLADENGMTVDEIVQRYEEARLEEEAEENNVPVEVLQRLKQLEDENEGMKQQNFSARFNAEVESTIQKYNASNEEVEQTFAYAHENGLTDLLKSGTMTFEAVHKLAHMDDMIESQVQKALQDNLSKKKKRQQDAQVSHGSAADYTTESLEDRAVADAKAIMANW